MNLRQFLTADRAVSPVIGVILMVAITVILAAVIGTFVLGLGDRVNDQAPQAQFITDYGGPSSVNFTHGSGDEVLAGEIKLTASESISIDKGDGTYSGGSTTVQLVGNDWSASETVTAGDIIYVQGADLSDDTIRIIWSAPSSDKTTVIKKWTGPAA